MENYLDNIKRASLKNTVEGIYCRQLKERVDPWHDTITGNKVAAIELYFIHWIMSYTNDDEFNFKNDLHVLEFFHAISLEHSFIAVKPNPSELLKTFYESVCYTPNKNNNNLQFKNSTISLWNSRIANLYILFKDVIEYDIGSHCSSCKEMVSVFETSFNYKMLVLLSYLNIELVEDFYNHIFDVIIIQYSDAELLSSIFKGYISKHIVQRYLHNNKKNNDATQLPKYYFLLSWISQHEIHRYINMPFATQLQRLLSKLQVDIYITYNRGHANGTDLGNSRMVNGPLAFVINSLIYTIDYNEDKYTSNRSPVSDYNKCGFKNIHCSGLEPHIVLRFFLEQMLYIEKNLLNIDHQILSLDKSPMDCTALCNILNSIDFDSEKEAYVYNRRVAILIMYVITTYHQKGFMRIHDIKYLPKLHTLPWMAAIEFCIADDMLHHIGAFFIESIIRCLGDCYLISLVRNSGLSSLSYKLWDLSITPFKAACIVLTKGSMTNITFIEGILQSIVYSITAYILGSIVLSEICNEKYNYSHAYCLVYHVLDRMLSHNYLEKCNNSYKMISVGKNESVNDTLEYNWLRRFIINVYNSHSSLCYLTLLEFVIIKYIISQEFDVGTAFDPNIMSLFHCGISTANSLNANDSQDHFRSIMASNYIAFHQNPINFLLRVPIFDVLQLMSMRMTFNAVIQLLDKMNKYIYFSYSSFPFQENNDIQYLCAIQQLGIINILLKITSNNSSHEVIRQMKGFISMLFCDNGVILDMVCSIGLSLESNFDLMHACCKNLCIPRTLESFKSKIKNMTSYNTRAIWSKYNIAINQDDDTHCSRTLKPFDISDIIAYNLYLVLVISECYNENNEEGDKSEILTGVKNVVSTVLKCAKTSNNVLFIKGTMNILLKLHYVFPILANSSASFIELWLQTEKEIDPLIKSLITLMRDTLKSIMEESFSGTSE
ncbi:hypothetical protein BdWA1_001892 [Babesia duncani]|uniref:Uncharacterized protein n=1 Tax=Babesia duncani TaxID=323732 RepID=A0AAD9UP17_9APIC|nr:hypothetical protein BdWA1_001892 [Babesia duncani]